MSTIESKLDQKQVAGGKTDAAVEAAKDKKKKGGEAAPGEEVKLSKKELNKLAKKEKKAGIKSGDVQPGVKGDTKGKKPATDAASKPLEYGTMDAKLSANLNTYETALKNGPWLNGAQLTSLDKEGCEFLKPHAFKLSPLTHPYTFSWYSLVSKFTP